ncbi:callose synthase 9-like [Bidens hawaiensis]|uniref:callose synthase 9-like n=1 Tax=Bidens hawaiensis TaxID=980011 RepID=UPI00404ADC92
MAAESDSDSQELWDRISQDDYVKYSVVQCFYTIKLILALVFDKDGKGERIYEDILSSLGKGTVQLDFQLKKLALIIQKVTSLTGILKEVGIPERKTGEINAGLDLYDAIMLDFCSANMRFQLQFTGDCNESANRS